MNSKRLAIFIFLMGFMTAAQAAYPLICRGGGSSGLVMGRAVAANTTPVYFSFVSDGHPYMSLSPGQCTWADRQVHSLEPSSVCVFSQLAPHFYPNTSTNKWQSAGADWVTSDALWAILTKMSDSTQHYTFWISTSQPCVNGTCYSCLKAD